MERTILSFFDHTSYTGRKEYIFCINIGNTMAKNRKRGWPAVCRHGMDSCGRIVMEYEENKNKGRNINLAVKRFWRAYGFFFYTLLFFLISFAGWLWEAGIYLAMEGRFVNRGVLFGPWLPIYGCGGVCLILLLKRWENRPVRVFFVSMVLCTVLEYLVSFVLERVWGLRWWDYSGEFMNISGRVCLAGSLLFGLGGWLLVCYMAPFLCMLYRKICKRENGRKWLQIICLALLLVFIADAAWAADFPHMLS